MQERSAWQLSPASDQVWARRLCGSSSAKTTALASSRSHLNSSARSLLKLEGTRWQSRPTFLIQNKSRAAFLKVRQQLGPVQILIANASGSLGQGLMETSPEQFEQSWRIGVCGAFLCAREAVLDMLECGSGAIIFTGATSSVRAKFAVRGLAQSLAVELWPKSIHVAHVIIDGIIGTPQVRKRHEASAKEPLLRPEAIAEAYWNLIQQDRSAWSLEIDLRPNKEAFFE
jgi:NAD(P)-dependent dehydrogenase (short-subunit alcohol dehydrogenase family)